MALVRNKPEHWQTRANEVRDLATKRNCMGENLLLLSCGVVFITGLVIAAANLLGIAPGSNRLPLTDSTLTIRADFRPGPVPFASP
jgi:hypothetical protein